MGRREATANRLISITARERPLGLFVPALVTSLGLLGGTDEEAE